MATPAKPAARKKARVVEPPRLERNPHKLGMAAAAFAAGLFLLWRAYLQYGDAPADPGPLAVGVLLTFVVTYAAVGFFLHFAFTLVARELESDEAAATDDAPAAAPVAQTAAPTAPENE